MRTWVGIAVVNTALLMLPNLQAQTAPAQNAPAAEREQGAVRQIIASNADPPARAAALMKTLPDLKSEAGRTDAYMYLAAAYVLTLRSGKPRDANVEKVFEELAESDFVTASTGCQVFAAAVPTLPVAEACARRFATKPAVLKPGVLDRLRGTILFEQGRKTEALPLLQAAADNFPASVDAHLHRRLVLALKEAGRYDDCCAAVKPLFRLYPKMPGIRDLLTTCAQEDTTALARRLIDERKPQLVDEARVSPAVPLPALSLQKSDGSPTTLQPGDQRTVIIFLSTWCPHCRDAMADINRFATSTTGKSVQLIGVRTYTRQETEPLERFVEKYQPQFPLLTDTDEGAAIREMARVVGRPRSVPLIVVVSGGRVVEALTPGQFDDLEQELTWLVTAPSGRASDETETKKGGR